MNNFLVNSLAYVRILFHSSTVLRNIRNHTEITHPVADYMCCTKGDADPSVLQGHWCEVADVACCLCCQISIENKTQNLQCLLNNFIFLQNNLYVLLDN